MIERPSAWGGSGFLFLGLSLALGGLALCLRLRSFWALFWGCSCQRLCPSLSAGGSERPAAGAGACFGEQAVRARAARIRPCSDPRRGSWWARYDTAERLLPICRTPGPWQGPGGPSSAQAPAVKCAWIPYRAVGDRKRTLLAVQCDQVTWGRARRFLVAFARTRRRRRRGVRGA
ncbi:MAG: hypothetical protein V8T29_01395 [Oscillospiraceae bacterium]